MIYRYCIFNSIVSGQSMGALNPEKNNLKNKLWWRKKDRYAKIIVTTSDVPTPKLNTLFKR